MKKMFSLLSLASLLVLQSSTVVFADELELVFSDVAGHEYESAIDYVQRRGIVNGYEDGTYRPDDLINRAEFTKILVEHLYDEADFNSFATESCFKDVPGGEWYTRYVCFAKDKNIVNGHLDGNFKPADEINYVEALKIVLESHESKGSLELPLSDISKYWYAPYIDFVQDQCVEAKEKEFSEPGCLELIGKVALDEDLTRAEAAVLIQWIGILTQ